MIQHELNNKDKYNTDIKIGIHSTHHSLGGGGLLNNYKSTSNKNMRCLVTYPMVQ